MDDAYHRYFAEAFESLPAGGDSQLSWLEATWGVPPDTAQSVVARIREAVWAADGAIEERCGRVLRTDAKWLLLLVFSQLMVQPVLAVRQESPEVLCAQAAADILHLASIAAEDTPEQEISSHRIVDALSAEWRDLELTRAAWWEETYGGSVSGSVVDAGIE